MALAGPISVLPRRGTRFLVAVLATLSFLCTFSAQSFASSEDEFDWKKEQEFWAFRAPVMPARPQVRNARWPQQDLDFFVVAKMERKGVTPSARAERRTLIRRLSYDLTGLPPTPAQVDAFLKDKRPDAYARLVDNLISSPAFGERMASLWLPLARYAEDQAHQVGKDTKFFYPNAYKYREWIIEAFNSDLPYDEFVRYQLAADKLGDAATNHLAALGFLGLGPKYYNRNRLEVMADEWEDRVDTVTRTFLGLTVACARCHDHKFEPITREDYYGLAGVFASTKMVNKQTDGAPDKAEKSEQMSATTVHMVEDDKIQDLNVFIRGNVDRKGPIAPRQFIRVLCQEEPAKFSEGSGRKELAEAIATAENPLTARVMVNRVWGAFFGAPIVASASNFGHSGERPSNAALLDFLAVRFVNDGWSIKKLACEIVLSATYQQSSAVNEQNAAIDPQNESLWKMNRRRLSVEQWRDALLFTSGALEPSGGKSLELDDPANHKRTVYARISRLQLNNMLMQFDYPDANVHAENRSTTTTAMQKLFALNSAFVLDCAKSLSERIASTKDRETQIRIAYRTLYAREPDATELKMGLEYLSGADRERRDEYAQALLISNEMMYVD
jgi:cytochrome c553